MERLCVEGILELGICITWADQEWYVSIFAPTLEVAAHILSYLPEIIHMGCRFELPAKRNSDHSATCQVRLISVHQLDLQSLQEPMQWDSKLWLPSSAEGPKWVSTHQHTNWWNLLKNCFLFGHQSNFMVGAGSLWTCTRGWHLTLMLCIVIEEMLCTHLRIEQSSLCVINCPSDSCSSWWGITHVGCVLNMPNLPSWVVHKWLICNDPSSSLLINFITWSMSKCQALNFYFQMYSWVVIRTTQLTQEVRLTLPNFLTHVSNLSKLSHMS
jgi:hypothetical protein